MGEERRRIYIRLKLKGEEESDGKGVRGEVVG